MPPSPTAHAAPTATGTIAAGSVRGRAPATQRRAPCGSGAGAGRLTATGGRARRRRGQGSWRRQHRAWVPCVAMPELVAVALPAGPAFVLALQRIWDRGDAVLPVDLRLPPPARTALLDALAPGSVLDTDGEHRRDGGREVEPGDALVVATSGTTGEPKGVVLTHDAVAASATASSARLGVGPGDHWLACLPLAHVGGLSVVTRAMVTGTPLTVLPGFDPAAVEQAALAGATLVSLVATALARIEPARFR